MKTWIIKHQLISFFVLTYLLAFSTGFGDILFNYGQMFGGWSLVWFINVFSPTISAIVISWVIGGLDEVKHLLSGFTRWKVNIGWYLAAAFMLFGPFMVALIYMALGNPVVGILPGVTLGALLGRVVFQFFSGPFSEEAGWRGFALPRLQQKYNALVSSLILGVIWTCWHLPLFFMTGQAQMGIPFPFYLLLVTTLSVYFAWLYNNTKGSLVITVLAHFCFNLTGTLITGLISLMPPMIFYMTASPLLGLATIGVVLYFRPRLLSRKADSEMPFQKA